MSLTPKQQAFVDEFLIDRNGKQAAIRAGYSEKTAEAQASRMLRNVKVAKVLDIQTEELRESAKLNAQDVLDIITDTILVLQEDDDKVEKNASVILKGAELYGKHLKLFTDKVEIGGDANNPLKATIEMTLVRPEDK